MSTERARADAGRGARRRQVRYTRMLAGTVVTLAVVVVALTLANALQGPRLADVTVDPSALVSRPEQSLVLRASQRLAPVEAADVRVEPAAPHRVTSDESGVTITFDGMLPYATRYTVTVDAATAATGVTSELVADFTTADADVFALVRNGATGADDLITRRALSDGESAQVLALPGIQEYAVAGSHLAAATVAADGTNSLVTAPAAGGGPTSPVGLPTTGTVTRLHGSGVTELFGFLFTPPAGTPERQTTLFVHDPTAGSPISRPVLGPDGQPLDVLDWIFVPDTTSVVAQASDLNLYLIDTMVSAAVVPLGQHQELRGFIPGTRSLVVADANGSTAIDVGTGESTLLELPPDFSQPDDYPGEVIVLGPDEYLEILMTPDYTPGATRLNPRVVHVGTEGARVVYEPVAEETEIRSMCVSPNGHHLAVELVDGDPSPDGYPNVPASIGMSTVILDIATGATVGGMNGFLPSWC
ncbi:hypothetical protein [Naasia sp. SYSU D00057]|uniref:hypothetical protein n=1 Tax=Naasia sp. SYSU D00057 TaxID=2817380 RepID=UPI001B317077|nr:hypothetical protein [Naasia sp. SYSU D00057]